MLDRLPVEMINLICQLGVEQCHWNRYDYLAFKDSCTMAYKSRIPDQLALEILEYACSNDRLDLARELSSRKDLSKMIQSNVSKIYHWIIKNSDSTRLVSHFLATTNFSAMKGQKCHFD